MRCHCIDLSHWFWLKSIVWPVGVVVLVVRVVVVVGVVVAPVAAVGVACEGGSWQSGASSGWYLWS